MEITIHCISEKIAEKLLGNTEDLQKKIKVCFCVEFILDSFIKTFLLFLIFASSGYVKEFILCWLTINFTRRYIGGLHMKTGEGCLIVSFLIYFVAIVMGEIMSLSPIFKLAVLIADILIAICYGPFPSAQRPRYSNKTKRKFRIKGIVGMCMVVMADALMHISTGCMLWILILQIIESIVVVLKINMNERRERHYEEGSDG